MKRSCVLSLAFTLCALGARAEDIAVWQRLRVTARSGASVALTPSRTQGGLGGGVGVTWDVTNVWLAQADVSWLLGLGSMALVRAGGAWQREGLWRPMVRADLELGLGGSLDFSVGTLPPSRWPSLGLTVGVGLLRWEVGRVVVSLLELAGGLSTDFVSVGPRFGVTALSLAVRLPW